MSTFRDVADAYGQYVKAGAALAGATTDSTTTVPGGQLDGQTARGVLGAQIEVAMLAQELKRLGRSITDDDRKAQATKFESSTPDQWKIAPDDLRAFLAERAAVIDAFTAAVSTPAADIEANYAKGVTASGVACVSHILVATEAEANDVLTRLGNGETFAAVAKEVSTDTNSAPAGGALVDQNGVPCTDAATFSSTYASTPEFVQGVLDAEVGVPSKPVQSQAGFHIILVRPLDEVRDSAVGLIQSTEKNAREAALFGTAKVSVSASVGTWDAATSSVVALDAASSDTSVGAG